MLYPSLKSRLKDQHTSLAILITDLDNNKLSYRPEPGKWNIHDNIAHLAVYQPIFINRINTILEKDKPTFNPYRADDDPVFLAWREWDIKDLLTRLNEDREQLYQLITNLSEQKLGRTGTHLRYGTLTVTQWTEFFLLHEAHHQFTIFKLAQGN
ncbi:DinB family protein [Mucilaginibacter sp. McL0603]|uniref:DinB family protein n=1 Tax=Mucilaginibacter sp. McL0603 TaxID=3415670 RepID=UPI003CF247EE